jgi:hypothetical protein
MQTRSFALHLLAARRSRDARHCANARVIAASVKNPVRPRDFALNFGMRPRDFAFATARLCIASISRHGMPHATLQKSTCTVTLSL